jgi:hypothetical protein
MTAWTRLAGRPGERLVLAVDFDATGRCEGTFRDLAEHLPSGREVWQTVPPPSGRDHLDWWLTGRPDGVVDTVLGYCAGGVFACALADRLPTRPDVVLVNPGPPTVVTLERDLRGALDTMTGLAETEWAELHQRTTEAARRHGTDFTGLAIELADVHAAASTRALERLGVDLDIAEDLIDLFGAYLAYLVAARTLPWRPGPADRAIVSRDHEGPVTADTTSLDMTRVELLRSARVAALLLANHEVA